LRAKTYIWHSTEATVPRSCSWQPVSQASGLSQSRTVRSVHSTADRRPVTKRPSFVDLLSYRSEVLVCAPHLGTYHVTKREPLWTMPRACCPAWIVNVTGVKHFSETHSIEEINNTNADGIEHVTLPKWRCEHVTHGRSSGQDKVRFPFS
jgi:hypothetical protein